MATSDPTHWDDAFTQDVTQRGWFQAESTASWSLLADVAPSASLLDVGAGAGVLAAEALTRGFTDVTVLDWSPVALQALRTGLGERASLITWIVADVTGWAPERTYDVWHDRAVLHFLLDEPQRAGYRASLLAATRPGSIAVVGTFAPTGPTMCAGLPVRRYSETDLAAFLAPDFTLEATMHLPHVRPDGGVQDYLWVRARRI